jgi:hypothetical protein
VDISCLEVIRELSNYMDDDVTPKLREHILAHLSGHVAPQSTRA